MKLSIIVPIYKVEPYLDKCVQSLLDQDISSSDYEIILVDDGSPDHCPELCDEYAAQHTNVRVIHRPNGGLSAARNSGLAVAQGQYIQFVDSDDYLESNVLGTLIAQMDREQLDVLRFDYQNVRLISSTSMPSTYKYEVFWPYKSPKPVDYRTDIVTGLQYLNERMSYACYATNYVIQRALLIDGRHSPILFTEGILYEDTEWTPRMLCAAQRVNATSLVAYNYLLRSGSITGTRTKEQAIRSIESKLVVNRTLCALARSVDNPSWLKGCVSSNVLGILDLVAQYDFSNLNLWIERLRLAYAFPLLAYMCSFKKRVKYRIVNLSPSLYAVLFRIFIAARHI